MLAGSGSSSGGPKRLSLVSPQPWVTKESLPNGSFQSSCKLPFPQPKITTTNNMGTIKTFKCILSHLIINHVQLVSGVLCAAVWSPWRHRQHHSGELMSSGCVLSAYLSALPHSSSGPEFLGRAPTSEDFLPFPAGSWWNAPSSCVSCLQGASSMGPCKCGAQEGATPCHPSWAPWPSLPGWLQGVGPRICHREPRSPFWQYSFKRVT